MIYAGLNPDTGHPIIKAFVNPLVSFVWLGVLITAFGTGLSLVPNTAQIAVKVPQRAAVAALAEEQSMQPAGVGK